MALILTAFWGTSKKDSKDPMSEIETSLTRSGFEVRRAKSAADVPDTVESIARRISIHNLFIGIPSELESALSRAPIYIRSGG